MDIPLGRMVATRIDSDLIRVVYFDHLGCITATRSLLDSCGVPGDATIKVMYIRHDLNRNTGS